MADIYISFVLLRSTLVSRLCYATHIMRVMLIRNPKLIGRLWVEYVLYYQISNGFIIQYTRGGRGSLFLEDMSSMTYNGSDQKRQGALKSLHICPWLIACLSARVSSCTVRLSIRYIHTCMYIFHYSGRLPHLGVASIYKILDTMYIYRHDHVHIYDRIIPTSVKLNRWVTNQYNQGKL